MNCKGPAGNSISFLEGGEVDSRAGAVPKLGQGDSLVYEIEGTCVEKS